MVLAAVLVASGSWMDRGALGSTPMAVGFGLDGAGATSCGCQRKKRADELQACLRAADGGPGCLRVPSTSGAVWCSRLDRFSRPCPRATLHTSALR